MSELQIQQWKNINSDLMEKLGTVLAEPNFRQVASLVFTLRDRYYADWRGSESSLHQKCGELILLSQQGDFVRAAGLARDLVIIKARTEACQAAYHEIESVLSRSKIVKPLSEFVESQPVPELSGKEQRPRNVIPLRRAQP